MTSELCRQGFGDPRDPTVLLVAGASCAMEWWDDELCERLAAAGRRVVRYDHRDTGRSPTDPPGHPTYAAGRLQDDCVGLLEELGGGHLVGLSLGGGIAQAVALRRPELVTTLTLVATSPVGGVGAELPGPSPSLREPEEDPDWADAEAYADWVLAGERAYAGTIPVDEERTRAMARRVHARSTDVAAAGNHWLALGAADGEEGEQDVHRITAPTLVVHGTQDPLFPLPHGEALAAAVPGARLLVVPGMGHQVPPPPTWELVVPAVVAHTGG